MTPTESIPAFGARDPAQEYVLRPGGYAVIRNDTGEVAVVITPAGAFLPGGGIEPGESPQDALRREAREECGVELAVGALIGHADEFLFAPVEMTHFQKRCAFFHATIVAHHTRQIDADHVLAWWPIERALHDLHHESQRWAVARAPGDGRP